MADINTRYDIAGFAYDNTSTVSGPELDTFLSVERDLGREFTQEVDAIDFSNIAPADTVRLIHQAYRRGMTDGHKVTSVSHGFATYQPTVGAHHE